MTSIAAIAFLLAAPLAASERGTSIQFNLPAQFNGDADISQVQRLLFLNMAPESLQSVELRDLRGASWTNHTLHYLNIGQEPVLGVIRKELYWSEDTGQAPADLGLALGRRGHASLYLEAKEIRMVASQRPGEIMSRFPPGEGYSYAAPLNFNEILYRAQETPLDDVYMRFSSQRAPTYMHLEASGVQAVEWFNAEINCQNQACPPGGGLHTSGAENQTFQLHARLEEASFIRLTTLDGTLKASGAMDFAVISGPLPRLSLNGTLRLPAAQLDAPCEPCMLDENRTMTLHGKIALDDLNFADNSSMRGHIRANLTAARLDEQAVNPLLLGLSPVGGFGAAAATVGLAIILKFFLASLFTRHKRDPLTHPRRQSIYAYICAHPGATFREVAREVNLAAGTARHHLTVLKRGGLIVEHPFRSSVRFFENHGKFANNWRETVILREPALAVLEDWVKAHPGAPQKDVLDAMAQLHGWSRSTTQHRLSRLVSEGLAHVQHAGRLSTYRPGAKPGVPVQATAARPLAIPSPPPRAPTYAG